LERVLEGAHALSVGLQAFAVRLMAKPVVWPLVQARVCSFQCLLLGEQGSALSFELRVRHGLSVRLLARELPTRSSARQPGKPPTPVRQIVSNSGYAGRGPDDTDDEFLAPPPGHLCPPGVHNRTAHDSDLSYDASRSPPPLTRTHCIAGRARGRKSA
jgi:hypothetical protein